MPDNTGPVTDLNGNTWTRNKDRLILNRPCPDCGQPNPPHTSTGGYTCPNTEAHEHGMPVAYG